MNEDGTYQIEQTERNKRLAAVAAIQPVKEKYSLLQISKT